MSKKINPLID